jgi:hypothetical protein
MNKLQLTSNVSVTEAALRKQDEYSSPENATALERYPRPIYWAEA